MASKSRANSQAWRASENHRCFRPTSYLQRTLLALDQLEAPSYRRVDLGKSGGIDTVRVNPPAWQDLVEYRARSFGGPDSDGDGIPDIGRVRPRHRPKIGIRSRRRRHQRRGRTRRKALTPSPARLPHRRHRDACPRRIGREARRRWRHIYAAGSGGLAVVDGTQFNNPIVLGQLVLPGTATGIGVDGNLKIAAVATGSRPPTRGCLRRARRRSCCTASPSRPRKSWSPMASPTRPPAPRSASSIWRPATSSRR